MSTRSGIELCSSCGGPELSGVCTNKLCFRTEVFDSVEKPQHYQLEGGWEVYDIIELEQLNFARGNVLKYLLRASKKGSEIEDLRKAAWYLQREISRLEEQSDG